MQIVQPTEAIHLPKRRSDRRTWFRIACLVGLAVVTSGSVALAGSHLVFIGTYTRGNDPQASRGIYVASFDDQTGTLSDLKLAAECVNPSFLALHPRGGYLYAVSEIGDFQGNRTGGIRAFRIEESGTLSPLNEASSSGQGPCHLVVDRAGKHVLVANYGSGTASVVAIADGGRLGDRTAFVQHTGSGPNARRQEAPHAHSINLDADNRYAFVADLGIDQIRIYNYDAQTGTLSNADPAFVRVPAGGGPRHFAWHPKGPWAFANNELLSSVNAFRYDGQGQLELVDTVSTLPPDSQVEGNTTAEVQVHPNGRFVYCSNRGHDSLAVMSIDEASGKLQLIENEPTGGRTPRNFAVAPSGKFVLAANQSSDNIVVFQVDEQTGKLQPTGTSLKVPTPVCIKFLLRP